MYPLEDYLKLDTEKALAKRSCIFKGQKYRISVLTDRVIRFEYNEEGIFEDRPSQLILRRELAVPNIKVRQDKKFIQLKTKNLTLEYQKELPILGSRLIPSNNLRVSIADTERTWYYNHPEVRNYRGTTHSLDNLENAKNFSKGLYSTDGFVSLDDSNTMVFNANGMLVEREIKGIDIYVFVYDKNFGLCLKDYFELTGYPPLLPRYALGNWWSREYPYTEKEVVDLIETFKRKEIPISVLLMDSDWKRQLSGAEKSESGFTWNEQLFPKPQEMIKNLHSNFVRLGLKIDPSDGLFNYDQSFSIATKYFPVAENEKIPFKPFDPKYLDVYLKLFIHPLDKMGVDFYWIDYHKKDEKYKQLFMLNHYHYMDKDRSEKERGLILSRNPEVAAHRYPVLYSGKTVVGWDTLKLIPYFNANSSNVGISWWSHDIGGSYGGIEENELYVRFIQLGTFSPIFRFNVEKGKYYKREPWRWDAQTKEIAEKYMKLRHRLIPYIYNEAYSYHKFGNPLIQPMYYRYPSFYDDALYRNQFFFGRDLLVVPIIESMDPVMNRVPKKIFLPKGIWYDIQTGKKFPGGKAFISFYKNSEYPVFAKGGAVIPFSNDENINSTSPPTNIELHVFPGVSNNFKLYEDDGITNLYKEGYYIITSYDYNYQQNNYTLIIKAIEGKSAVIPKNRNYKIRFRNTKQADDVIVFIDKDQINVKSYVDENDFIVEVNNIPSLAQTTINCKGKDIEIDASKVFNEDIESIIEDIQVSTKLKEAVAAILFSDIKIKKKRIGIRKLKKKGLDKEFIRMFLNLLEHIKEV